MSFCGSMYWMQKIIMRPACETACSIFHFIFIYHSASCTPTPCKKQRGHNTNWISMRTCSCGIFTIFTFRLLLFIDHSTTASSSQLLGYGGSFGSYFDWNLWFEAWIHLLGTKRISFGKKLGDANYEVRITKYKVHDTRYITSIKWRSIV